MMIYELNIIIKNMLTEQRRLQLDGIVKQMVGNKESDANIQWVVDDFKRKYEGETTKPAAPQEPQQPQGIFSRLKGGIERAEAIPKDILVGAGRVGEKIISPLAKTFAGTSGRVIGSLIGAGAEAGKELVTGKPTQQRFQKEMEEITATPKTLAKELLFTGLEMYPGGGFITKAFKKIPGGSQIAKGLDDLIKFIPQKLRANAVKQYSQALGAATKETKTITSKIVPELLERKVVAGTRPGLQIKAEKGLRLAGEQFDEALKNIPESRRLKIQPIIDKLRDYKNKFIVKGVDIEPLVTKQVDELADIIGQFGDDVDFHSLRRVRQIWDDVVAKTKGFTKILPEGTAPDIKKTATNAIRNELAKDSPTVAKINAEYSLWKSLKTVVDETLKRTSTQGTPLGERIAQQVGVGAGLVKKGVGYAILTGVILKNFVKLTSSTGWRTISAVNKNKLAKLLVDGNIKNASLFINKLIAGIKNIGD